MGGSRRGSNRERLVKERLLSRGYWVARAAASLGDADLVALKAGEPPYLIEVKATTAGPFSGFGPKDREELRRAARKAGAEAILVWWPMNRPLRWIAESEWPS